MACHFVRYVMIVMCVFVRHTSKFPSRLRLVGGALAMSSCCDSSASPSLFGHTLKGENHTGYLRIENAEGYVLIAVYLFIYLYACYSHNTKSFKPNRMKYGGMIGYYPGTI